jgi:hypothetical protein
VAFLEKATARMISQGVVRVLLDECVDRRLAADIQGHDVRTMPEAGWAALKNGDLLSRAQHELDALVTTDRNLPFQEDLSRFPIAIIVLRARSNRVVDLRRLIPELLAALPVARRGVVRWVGAEQRA